MHSNNGRFVSFAGEICRKDQNTNINVLRDIIRFFIWLGEIAVLGLIAPLVLGSVLSAAFITIWGGFVPWLEMYAVHISLSVGLLFVGIVFLAILVKRI